MIYDWITQRDLVCELISSQHRFLKIVLKTKNETALLDWWLQHHLPFGGDGSIIVFDNESTEPAVLDIYQKYGQRLILVSYGGNPDILHDVDQFSDLYKSLQSSSELYTFIDTDEKLYFTDGLKFFNDVEVIREIIPLTDHNQFFAGYWAHGIPLCDNQIDFGSNASECQGRHAASKPIMPASFEPKGVINHTFQLMEHNPNAEPLSGFVVCHHKYINLQRRVDINVEKILALGFADSIEHIISSLRSIESSAKNEEHARYLFEIYACMSGGINQHNKKGEIEILTNGDILLMNDAVQEVFRKYVFEFSDFVRFNW